MTFKNLMVSEDEYRIPPTWEWAKLPDIIGNDGVFADGDWVESKDQDPNGDVRLIQLADIGDGFYRNRSDRYLTLQKAYKLNCTFLEPGDLLIARMPDPLGRATIFPGDIKRSVTVVDVCIVRTKNEIDHRWLIYMINAPQFRLIVESLQSGTTRKRISRKNLAKIDVPVAPLNEQRRIVDAIEAQFTRLDAGIAALKRLEANLKRYKASVLKAACEGELVPQDPDDEPASDLLARILQERREKWEAEQLAKYEAQGKNPPKGWQDKYQAPVEPDTDDLPELPEGWMWAGIKEVCERIVDCLHSTPKFQEDGFMCIDTNTIKPGKIIEEKILFVDEETFHDRNRRMVPLAGDVMFIREGALLGVAVEVPKGIDCCLGQRMIIFRLSASMRPKFYEHVLNSMIFRMQYAPKISGSASPHLNITDIRKMAVPLPPINAQERILEALDLYISIIEALKHMVSDGLLKANRLRQSILREAFAGRLVPQDPSDEPASELLKHIQAEREK
jgi:type I restriction enzyme S subunit